MGFKRRISEWAAARFLCSYCRRLDLEAPWSIPWSVWRRIPRCVRHWVEYRVLVHGEEAARRCVGAHEVLRRLPDNRHNGFAITPAAMLYLWRLVQARRPRRILEFGSGLSTRIFAAYAAAQADRFPVRICTVEHDAAWLDDVRRSLQADGLNDYVELVHAPLLPWMWRGTTFTGYGVHAEQLEAAARPGGFDLCFIDGPPRTVGRFGCLPLAEPHLAEDAVVLLDDCLRTEEQLVLERIRGTMGNCFTPPRMLLLDAHGMAIFQHRKTAPAIRDQDAPQLASPGDAGDLEGHSRPGRTETDSERATVVIGTSRGSDT